MSVLKYSDVEQLGMENVVSIKEKKSVYNETISNNATCIKLHLNKDDNIHKSEVLKLAF